MGVGFLTGPHRNPKKQKKEALDTYLLFYNETIEHIAILIKWQNKIICSDRKQKKMVSTI